jgi:outer membrane biosynthesis protein TonB
MKNSEISMVWPLVSGLQGVNPSNGETVTMNPFSRQWMYTDDAVLAEGDGKVQMMVGLTPADLKTPDDVKTDTAESSETPKPEVKKQAQPKPKKKGKVKGKEAEKSDSDTMLD